MFDPENSRQHQDEVAAGQRFEFGKNWLSFLDSMDSAQVEASTEAVRRLLDVDDLAGKSFLDVGSGSGLSSLAAVRLGAARVHSFDFDPSSVSCTIEMRNRFVPGFDAWTVDQGSALDGEYLKKLGKFDVVYSWGVLHHTGDLQGALRLVGGLVAEGGTLALAIYNDQGRISRVWLAVKKVYCSGLAGRLAIKCVFYPYFALGGLVADLRRKRGPMKRYRDPLQRGMSVVHDWRDWLGGLPFEVATPDTVRVSFEQRGFETLSIEKCNGLGCNEFVFRRWS